jgi:hypothetical protein
VLGDRHQLDVREAQRNDVVRQRMRQLAVAEHLAVAAPPRAGMQLVDRERRIERVVRAACGHPVGIVPVVAELPGARRGRRRLLGAERERIGLVGRVAVVRHDAVLVGLPAPHLRHAALPDAAVVGAPRQR